MAEKIPGAAIDADGQLCMPSGICFDRTGQLVVADYGNSRIQIFDITEKKEKFVLKFGAEGTKFDGIYGVVCDSQGRILCADAYNNRVQIFTSTGEFITQIGGSGDGVGILGEPVGIAIDIEDRIYVCERANSRVQVFSPEGQSLLILGVGSQMEPSSVAVDRLGNMAVFDSEHSFIQLFSHDGYPLKKIEQLKAGDENITLRSLSLVLDDEGNIIFTNYDDETATSKVLVLG